MQDIKTNEVQSIDNQQKQSQRAQDVFNQQTFKRFFSYLTLSTQEKQAYKLLRSQKNAILNDKKKNFDKKNVFEVEHYDF
jgi:hypothetical protein